MPKPTKKPGRTHGPKRKRQALGHAQPISILAASEQLVGITLSPKRVAPAGTFTVTVFRAKSGTALTVTLLFVGLGVPHATPAVSFAIGGDKVALAAADTSKQSVAITALAAMAGKKILVIAKTGTHYCSAVLTVD